MEAAVAWLVGLILDDAKQWGWAKAKEAVLGSPFERAVTRVTAAALSRAVRDTLGPDAPPDSCTRMEAIIDQVWPNVQLYLPSPPPAALAGLAPTLLDRLRSSIAAAMRVATTPVLDLGNSFETTTSLALLSDEIGVPIDDHAFTDTLVACWAAEVRALALTNPAIEPVADQVDHAETLGRLDTLQSAIGREIGRAVQVLTERLQDQATAPATITERWFTTHIDPVDAELGTIYDDYNSGFQDAILGLRTSADGVVPKLQSLRLRGLSSRINAQALAIALKETPLDDTLREAMLGYADGVLQFLHGADPSGTQTWYSEYIERFTMFLGRGDDPHNRALYTTITLPSDPIGAIRASLTEVVQVELPGRYQTYKDAYQALRLVCIPLEQSK